MWLICIWGYTLIWFYQGSLKVWYLLIRGMARNYFKILTVLLDLHSAWTNKYYKINDILVKVELQWFQSQVRWSMILRSKNWRIFLQMRRIPNPRPFLYTRGVALGFHFENPISGYKEALKVFPLYRLQLLPCCHLRACVARISDRWSASDLLELTL